jgi:hypothetical protein
MKSYVLCDMIKVVLSVDLKLLSNDEIHRNKLTTVHKMSIIESNVKNQIRHKFLLRSKNFPPSAPLYNRMVTTQTTKRFSST